MTSSINSTGAVISTSEQGGSLAKVIWFSPSPCGNGGRLNFTFYETSKIDDCINFVRSISEGTSDRKRIIKATGGGAHKFAELITQKLDVLLQKEDEMECLITGLNFLVRKIPNEVFTYDERRAPEPLQFEQSCQQEIFPYMLVNIGSGVSILKVTSDETFERISGTSLGGGTLWGLLSLLTGAKSYDDMLKLSQDGDNKNVDMLVGDIYGSGYSKIGLKATTIASSFGKVFKASKEDRKNFKPADISRSLLYLVSNNIGQIAYLNAISQGIKRIYFSGFFIRGHPITMNTLSYAISFWSKGSIKALFLRHEGYLGAMGAFLRDTNRRRPNSFSAFTENFSQITKISGSSPSVVGFLDTLPVELEPFPHISVSDYKPDTQPLSDPSLQSYWINLLDKNLGSLVDLALEFQSNGEDTAERAKTFESMYRTHLHRLSKEPSSYGELTVRALLDLREQCLKEMGFVDVFAEIKRRETQIALLKLPEYLEKTDILEKREKIQELIANVLAGNMYDWGANSIQKVLKQGNVEFEKAKSQVNRPLKFDDSIKFTERLLKSPYRKAIVFVDNSGADIVLGILPLARFLVSQGTRVVLASNSYPCINDVTDKELLQILNQIQDNELFNAWETGMIKVVGNGSGSPCLDLSRISSLLRKESQDADLVIIEGMGRAIHTNFHAKFNIDSLKIGVFKNPQIAAALDAALYDGIVLFDSTE